MDDPWHLITQEPIKNMPLKHDKEKLSLKYTHTEVIDKYTHTEVNDKYTHAEVNDKYTHTEVNDNGYEILKSDVHWHNSEPVSTNVFGYVLTDKPGGYTNDDTTEERFCWRIHSTNDIETNVKHENGDDSDNRSESGSTSSSSSTSSDGCHSIESISVLTIPRYDNDIVKEVPCCHDTNPKWSSCNHSDTHQDASCNHSDTHQDAPCNHSDTHQDASRNHSDTHQDAPCNHSDIIKDTSCNNDDILNDVSYGILKDVNYEFHQVPFRKKKKEKPIKISPIFQQDPYFTNQRMLINKRQNDRLYTLNSTFKYLNNNLPPYVKCNDVRDNTKLGILRRAIKYINLLVALLHEDDNITKDQSLTEGTTIDTNTGAESSGDNMYVEHLDNSNSCDKLYGDTTTTNKIMNACLELLIDDNLVERDPCVELSGDNSKHKENDINIGFLMEDISASNDTYVDVLGDQNNNSIGNIGVELLGEVNIDNTCVDRLEIMDDRDTGDDGDNNNNIKINAYNELLEEIDH